MESLEIGELISQMMDLKLCTEQRIYMLMQQLLKIERQFLKSRSLSKFQNLVEILNF